MPATGSAGAPAPAARFRTPPWLLLAYLGLTLSKLWLTSADEVVASSATHDQMLYARLADSFAQHRWLGDYDQLTLLRPPAYPVFVALVRQTAVPLRLAVELLLVGAALALSTALLRSGMPPWVGAASAFAVVFAPHSFEIGRELFSETLYTPALVLAVASSLRLAFGDEAERPRWRHGAILGVAAAVCWHARPEHLLVALQGGVLGALLLRRGQGHGRPPRQTLRDLLPAWGPATALILLASLAIRTTNHACYGLFVHSELFGAPGFAAARHALLRVGDDAARPYVSVTARAREKAYEASEHFRTLAPWLEGTLKGDWTRASCLMLSVCDDYADGWFLFALRDAAAAAGHYRSAPEADRFWTAVANEVHAACDDGRVPCRSRLAARLRAFDRFAGIPRSTVRVLARFAAPPGSDSILAESPRPEVKTLYDRIALRRRALVDDADGDLRLAGWAFGTDGPVTHVLLEDGAGSLLGATSLLVARPDVRAHFRARGEEAPERPGFELVARKPAGVRIEACRLGLLTASGRLVWVPVDGVVHPVPIRYSIDLARETITPIPMSRRLQAPLIAAYRHALLPLGLATLVAVVVLVRHWRRGFGAGPGIALALAFFMSTAVFSRVLLFAYVDAAVFHVAPRYVYPVTGLLVSLALVVISQAVTVHRARHR